MESQSMRYLIGHFADTATNLRTHWLTFTKILSCKDRQKRKMMAVATGICRGNELEAGCPQTRREKLWEVPIQTFKLACKDKVRARRLLDGISLNQPRTHKFIHGLHKSVRIDIGTLHTVFCLV